MFLQELKESDIFDFNIIDLSSLNRNHTYSEIIKEDLRVRFRPEYFE